MKSNI